MHDAVNGVTRTDRTAHILRYAYLRWRDGLGFNPAQSDSTVDELGALIDAGLLQKVMGSAFEARGRRGRPALTSQFYLPTDAGYRQGERSAPLDNEHLIFVRDSEQTYITPFSRRKPVDQLPAWSEVDPLILKPGDRFLRTTINPRVPNGEMFRINWLEVDGRFVIAHTRQPTVTGTLYDWTTLWRIGWIALRVDSNGMTTPDEGA